MNPPRNIERMVGIFIFIGILVTGGLILHFGKVGDRFRGGYPIRVEFNNAGGLVKGAQVLYSGVLVGKVQEVLLKPAGDGVFVDVNMFEGAQVAVDSKFLIKQSGLLGDKHIVITAGSRKAAKLASGSEVRGTDPFDFNDAATEAGDTVKKLSAAIDKLSSEVVQGDTVENIKKSIKNFNDLTKKLQANSDKLDTLLTRAQKGEGTIGKLLTDDELFWEAKRLIHNWRVHGLLHSDEGDERYPSPRKGPADAAKSH